MATVPQSIPEVGTEELHSGDRMTQKEFHRIYEKMPKHFKAELIGGVVYVASPLRRPHGKDHLHLGSVLNAYEGHTPGVDAGDNTTIILSKQDEPQPDLYLRILPEYGGRSGDTKTEYIKGQPELLAEIAHSSRAIDLGDKRDRYAQCGVREYIVVCLRPRQVRWFDLKTGEEFAADANGVFKSVHFPGLWVYADALLQRDYKRLMDVLNQGLATPEHAAFVARLAAARTTPESPSS